jgi:hypothetical protein
LPLLVLGGVCGGFAAFALVATIVVIAAPGMSPIGAAVSIIALLTFAPVSISILWAALKRRASDLIVEGELLRIEGGPHHGVSFSPADIDSYGATTIEVEDEYQENSAGDHVHARILRLSLRDRGEIDLAKSWEPADPPSPRSPRR